MSIEKTEWEKIISDNSMEKSARIKKMRKDLRRVLAELDFSSGWKYFEINSFYNFSGF